MIRSATLVFGSQLFHKKYRQNLPSTYLMIESDDLCDYFKFHKQKIYTYLASMRSFRDELVSEGSQVIYHALTPGMPRCDFWSQLEVEVNRLNLLSLHVFEVEDTWVEQKLIDFCRQQKIELVVHTTPQFLFSRGDFSTYLASTKKPFMKTYYERQRKKTGLLMDLAGKPLGGQFSFDEDNRKKLKKNDSVPPQFPSLSEKSKNESVLELIKIRFADHPGELTQLWAPTSRGQALKIFEDFFTERFPLFGDFEDTLTERSDFVYHSGLSTALNMGWLTPQALINAIIRKNAIQPIPLNSLEGFIRQIMGWREFIRGIYQNFNDQQVSSNFFGHHLRLSPSWYTATTGIPPLDACLRKANRLGYNHHIERLMVICNIMNLLGIAPKEVHRWFMEMYIDSADWVMGPNVFGMGLMSDGGLFATKPYICGSNYFFKMSDELKRGEWCDEVDGLYWQFIERNQSYFQKNPRLSMMTSSLAKMPSEKKSRLFSAADNARQRLTNR